MDEEEARRCTPSSTSRTRRPVRSELAARREAREDFHLRTESQSAHATSPSTTPPSPRVRTSLSRKITVPPPRTVPMASLASEARGTGAGARRPRTELVARARCRATTRFDPREPPPTALLRARRRRRRRTARVGGRRGNGEQWRRRRNSGGGGWPGGRCCGARRAVSDLLSGAPRARRPSSTSYSRR